MANLTTKSFTTLVQDQVTSIQGASKYLIDLTIGSILRVVVEANASVQLWLQSLILQLLATTRAASSVGLDLDSWVNDFGVARLVAVAASGLVTFSRFTSSLQAIVTVGATVQTADGTQQYTVILDTTNVNYSALLGGYVLAIGVPSISVPVIANTASSASNAQAGQINTITSAIAGVDTVTNTLTFTNGIDAETDAALRVRFVAYIASLSKATKSAIGYAITSIQQGAVYSITENVNYAGAAQNGYFYVVVDDGTGTPSGTFLTNVGNAVELVRPFTSTYGVFAPIVVPATVVLTASIAAGYDPVATKALVQSAILSYINSLSLGVSLTYTRLLQVAYDASVGVTNITAFTLNGAAVDLTANNKQVIKSSSVTVN